MNNYTEKQIEWLRVNYPIKTLEECCRHLKRKGPSIKHIAYKNGIKKAKYYQYQPIKINLHCPEFIYLLGFIWADGHVSRNGNKIISETVIQRRDGENLLPVFQKVGDFRVFYRFPENRQPTMGFCNRDVTFNTLLFKNDYMDKSYVQPTKILQKIPKKLQYYFWRGYFDGDGCVSAGDEHHNYKCVNICGTYNYQWGFYKQLLNKLKIKFNIKRRKEKSGKHSNVDFYKADDILKFFHYIYPKLKYDNIELKRKYDKFCLIEVKNESYINKFKFKIKYKNTIFFGNRQEIQKKTKLSFTQIYRLRKEFKNHPKHSYIV